MALHCTPAIISGFLLCNAVIKTRRLWTFLCLLAGFEENDGGVTNIFLLPSGSAGAWDLVDFKENCITNAHTLLYDQVAFVSIY